MRSPATTARTPACVCMHGAKQGALCAVGLARPMADRREWGGTVFHIPFCSAGRFGFSSRLSISKPSTGPNFDHVLVSDHPIGVPTTFCSAPAPAPAPALGRAPAQSCFASRNGRIGAAGAIVFVQTAGVIADQALAIPSRLTQRTRKRYAKFGVSSSTSYLPKTCGGGAALPGTVRRGALRT
jgi:hypothetical protein